MANTRSALKRMRLGEKRRVRNAAVRSTVRTAVKTTRTALAAAACVVAVLSPDTLGSQWVALALSYAREYRVPVIPVVVSGEPGHILLVKLDGSDWFDLRYNSRYTAEAAALAALVRQHIHARRVEMA